MSADDRKTAASDNHSEVTEGNFEVDAGKSEDIIAKGNEEVTIYQKLHQEALRVEKEHENGPVMKEKQQITNDGEPMVNGEEVKTPKNDSEESGFSCSEIFRLLAILVAITAIGAALFFNQQNFSGFVSKSSFKKNLKDLQATFTHQNDYLWKSVGKLGNSHIDDVEKGKAKRPLVLLLLSTNGNEKVLSCMARRIAMSFSHDGKQNQPPIVMSGNDIANSAHSKEKLDEKLGEELAKNKGVVVITKIDSLPYETASIFFKYCDNEGAPHPNAVFIFTLTLPGDESILSTTSKEITGVTWKHLRSVVWEDGDSAGKDALIARIVDPAPIPVQSEDESVVNTCPVFQ